MSEPAAFFSEESEGSRALPAPQGRALVLLRPPAAHEERRGWSSQAAFDNVHFAEGAFAEAAPAPERQRGRFAGRWRAVASLTAIVMIGGLAAAQIHFAGEQRAHALALGRRIEAIATKLQGFDAARPREELASLKKALADLKANSASARDVAGAVAALTGRVDRLEREEASRLEKLDRDTGQRLADISQRLEKLEGKPVASAQPKTEVAKSPPAVSYETTGSIEKPRPRLRNFYLADIRNGYAMIEGPAGGLAVAPGDNVPGGGRVLRIEKHGREWVVVTTLGEIATGIE